MGTVVFLDTSYAIALLSPRDQYHAVAKRLGADLKSGDHKVVAFVLVRERGIPEALTADEHFVQAEIKALLLPT